MKGSKMPSILCFSTVMLFYGNKKEIEKLLIVLKKGGREFFKKKVLNGAFFRSEAMNTNAVEMNYGLYKRIC